jgi:hypothetical protein
MQKKTSALVAALTMMAIVLSAILLATGSQRAEAGMLDATADFSLMTAGSGMANEPLVVVDKNARKMLVYELVNGNELKVSGYFVFGK